MSLIRLSAIKNELYAPYPNGNLDYAPYDRRRMRGMMDRLKEHELFLKKDPLWHYMQRQTKLAALDLTDSKPLVVMVHGFLFDPKQAVSSNPAETDNPHGRLYHYHVGDMHDEIRHHTSGWPHWLGFDEHDETGKTGMALGYGWLSQPGFATSLITHFQNFYSRAYGYAEHSSWLLVNLMESLHQLLPGKPIDLFCHSLGSRVVIRAIAQAAKYHPHLLPSLGRVIIMGGAEYVVEAQLMMRRLQERHDDHPHDVCFYNIVSRENDVLDKLGENFGPRTFGNTQVIGHNGLDVEDPGPRWLDMQIDDKQLEEWLSTHKGLSISGDRPGNVWDHWYYYTYRGNMELYKRILRERDSWNIPDLRAAGIPDKVSKRWSVFGD